MAAVMPTYSSAILTLYKMSDELNNGETTCWLPRKESNKKVEHERGIANIFAECMCKIIPKLMKRPSVTNNSSLNVLL
jgi:hypothetical protein